MLQAEVYFAERSARADMSAFDALTQVAYQATLQGYEVRYVEADSAFTHYCLASPGEQTQLLKAMLDGARCVGAGRFVSGPAYFRRSRRIAADAGASTLQFGGVTGGGISSGHQGEALNKEGQWHS